MGAISLKTEAEVKDAAEFYQKEFGGLGRWLMKKTKIKISRIYIRGGCMVNL